MSGRFLQLTSQLRNLFPLISQHTKNGLVKQIRLCSFTSSERQKYQSLAFLADTQQSSCNSSQNENTGNGKDETSFSKSPEIFLISLLLLCHCEEDKGETVFNKKEFWFFHYFLRSIGRRSLRQGAGNEKRTQQPFDKDTISQILAIIKEGDEIKDLSVKVLDQLIIYAEEVIYRFDKKAKSKSAEADTSQKQIYLERRAQWQEILQLLQQQRDAKK